MPDRDLPARWTDDVRHGARRGARLPTRDELRQLVAEHQMEIREVVAVGANPRQLMLDQREKVRAYAAQLSRSDAETFMRMYAQETTTTAEQPADDVKQLAAPASPSAPRARLAGALIAAIVVLLALIVLYRTFA